MNEPRQTIKYLRSDFFVTEIKKTTICLGIIIAFGGCQPWTSVPTPSYIQISNYVTKVAPGGYQGTANQNFTDMLVIANGTTYGIFPLGSKIPVIGSGQLNFTIRGVVEINGVSALRSAYEVMKGSDTTISVQLGKVTNVVPEFQYFSGATFPLVQDFDNTGGDHIQFVPNPSSDTTSHRKPCGMGGGNCLALMPNSTDNQGVSMVQTATNSPIGLPAKGVGIYMEFNYMGTIPINVAIQGVPSGGTPTAITSCGGVYPSPTWQKVYIQLTEQVSSLQSGLYYIYFTSLYDDLVTSNVAYVDNVKIVAATQ